MKLLLTVGGADVALAGPADWTAAPLMAAPAFPSIDSVTGGQT